MEAIRSKRIEAGLPLAEVARRSGVNAVTLSRIENGHVLPRDYTVGRIARALGVSPAELFETEEQVAP